MNYLGRSIYGGTEGGTPTTNPFDQSLNSYNDVRFSSVIGARVRVGGVQAAPLYELPIDPPTDPNQVLLWDGNIQNQLVFRHPFEQDLSTSGSPTFQNMDINGGLTLVGPLLLEGGVSNPLTVGTPGFEYSFPNTRSSGDGALLVSNGAGNVSWSETPAYASLFYHIPINSPNTITNRWVGSTIALEPVSFPLAIPYTFGPARDIRDTSFDTGTNRGLQLESTASNYEIALSACLDVTGPLGQVEIFVGGATASSFDPIVTTPINNTLSGFSRTTILSSNANLSITGYANIGLGSQLWIGILPEVTGQTIHVRSLSLRIKSVIL
jgi:hypothetical protein